MKLIVGLGNPGQKYAGTRHNAGFEVLLRLAERHSIRVSMSSHQSLIGRGKIANESVYLQQPLTYMNLSGGAVSAAVRAFEIPLVDLIVVSDDLDLPLGTIRVRANGSSGGQKGLKSIINCLGTEEFARVRVGIGRPPEGMTVEDYVLTKWNANDKEIFVKAVETAADAVETYLRFGVEEAANMFNRRSE